MLTEYHFKIQYTKGTKNVRVDALSRKAELQNKEKLLEAILHKDKGGLVRYNYLKIIVIREEKTYKIPKSVWL